MKKKPYSPNYRRPPRPEPAVILPYELDDDGEHVVLPLYVRPCDLLRTWAEARREATS